MVIWTRYLRKRQALWRRSLWSRSFNEVLTSRQEVLTIVSILYVLNDLLRDSSSYHHLMSRKFKRPDEEKRVADGHRTKQLPDAHTALQGNQGGSRRTTYPSSLEATHHRHNTPLEVLGQRISYRGTRLHSKYTGETILFRLPNVHFRV